MAPGGCAQAARPHRAVPGCGTPRVAPAPAPPGGCGVAPPPGIHYANEAARPRPPGKKTRFGCRLPFTGSELLREAQHLLQFPTRGQEAPQGTNRKAALGRANSRPPKAAAPASPPEQGVEETSRFPAQLHLPGTKQEHEVLSTRGTHQFLHCIRSDFTCDSNLGSHSSNTWGLLRKDQS